MKYLSILLLLMLSGFSCQSQEAAPCPFNFQGYQAADQCGYLEVPLDYDNPNGEKVKIAYLLIKSKVKQPNPDPIVFIQGGPGGEVLQAADFFQNLNFDNSRDFILYDYRGTGYSGAICPNMNESIIKVFAQDLNIQEEGEKLMSLMKECAAATGVRRAHFYNTNANTRDLEALRKHLGYSTWNLYGGSYGTRMARLYMDLYPDRVRSATLVSLFPSNVRFYENIFSNFDRSLQLLFTKCQEDPTCNKDYPDLADTFQEAIKRLEEHPLSYDWNRSQFTMNEQDFLLMSHQMLYDARLASNIPAFIKNVKNREIIRLSAITNTFTQRMGGINPAIYWAVMAGDEGAYDNRQLLKRDWEKYPTYKAGMGLFFSDPELMQHWQEAAPSYSSLNVNTTDIPTLLVSGEIDPITPPSNAEKAAQSLTNAYIVNFAEEGHTPFNPCFFKLAKAFVNKPHEKPNTKCAENNSALNW